MLAVHDVDVPPSELRFHRSSGRVCLDLVGTIGERWRRRFERLRDPEDLQRWLDGVGLAPEQGVGAGALHRIRDLRGAIEQLAIAAIQEDPYPSSARARVNAAAALVPPVPHLDEGGARTTRIATADHAASAIARDAIALFGGPSAAQVRECSADDCALVFLDTSRSANRRWCSMRACGNRTKAARHRARRRSQEDADMRGPAT